MSPNRPVLAVIGAGSMGVATARRLGPSHHILISDFSPATLSNAEDSLRSAGHSFTAQSIDVSKKEFVASFAEAAAKLGPIQTVVVTAGVSNAANNAELIYNTNLLGVAFIIDSFQPLMAPGGSLTVIASMAGHMKKPNSALDDHFATASATELLNHADINLAGDPGDAYSISKRGCIVRVRHAAIAWGRQGNRINTVSPGVTMTPMIAEVMQSAAGSMLEGIIKGVPLGRIGTPDDIAGAVAFLAGPDATYVNGADLLVDGGSRATHRWPGTEAGAE
ncbi:hypothetical protein K456DRAFT_33646 [Colletotrichum gloeosporioides 23]|nr:hypothetical protein K456DRAFT_33646 [Colletotrichum gloeosporioides 23]